MVMEGNAADAAVDAVDVKPGERIQSSRAAHIMLTDLKQPLSAASASTVPSIEKAGRWSQRAFCRLGATGYPWTSGVP
jgi:hypothetical protein